MEIEKLEGYSITIGNEYYIRFGEDSWYKWYWDTLEPVYSSYSLELEFQKVMLNES